MDHDYDKPDPDRSEVETWPGAAVLEFGASWCGICRAAQPAIAAALADYPAVRHVKVGDGPGQPLGRSYRVKLWPTLIFLRDGVEQHRVVRPRSDDEIRGGLQRIA